mmetsp:Transcript_37607/g.64123  ORF Transcript_37607/g.64123 Transcript_37607/m.64123 type:complete len:200 (+) Transcript_37607:885-1484(+)
MWRSQRMWRMMEAQLLLNLHLPAGAKREETMLLLLPSVKVMKSNLRFRDLERMESLLLQTFPFCRVVRLRRSQPIIRRPIKSVPDTSSWNHRTPLWPTLPPMLSWCQAVQRPQEGASSKRKEEDSENVKARNDVEGDTRPKKGFVDGIQKKWDKLVRHEHYEIEYKLPTEKATRIIHLAAIKIHGSRTIPSTSWNVREN